MLIAFCQAIHANSQTIDSAALKIVDANLRVINDYLKDPNSDPTHKRARAITFLTYLTGIPSQSDGSFSGQLSPTPQDYKNWVSWTHFYKSNLIWDKSNNKIIVHKEVAVTNVDSLGNVQ